MSLVIYRKEQNCKILCNLLPSVVDLGSVPLIVLCVMLSLLAVDVDSDTDECVVVGWTVETMSAAVVFGSVIVVDDGVD